LRWRWLPPQLWSQSSSADAWAGAAVETTRRHQVPPSSCTAIPAGFFSEGGALTARSRQKRANKHS
ncbi:unnamed protein product, partial [Polarella glacialis]